MNMDDKKERVMNPYLKTFVIVTALLTPTLAAPLLAETPKADMAMQKVNPQKISINTATAAELQMLKGIGEAKAKAIVEYREANGKFSSLEELTKVKGIGAKFLEKNAELLTL
jgi:competence protein ComEA